MNNKNLSKFLKSQTFFLICIIVILVVFVTLINPRFLRDFTCGNSSKVSVQAEIKTPFPSRRPKILPLLKLPVTTETLGLFLNASGLFCVAQPVNIIFACGFIAVMRLTVWRDFFSASAVTAQVFTI